MSPDLAAEAAQRRAELVETVANVDEQLGELFLMEEPIDEHTLREAVRRATVSSLSQRVSELHLPACCMAHSPSPSCPSVPYPPNWQSAAHGSLGDSFKSLIFAGTDGQVLGGFRGKGLGRRVRCAR